MNHSIKKATKKHLLLFMRSLIICLSLYVFNISSIKASETNKFVTVESLQQKTVHGKVSDISGDPLPGVTIVIKGTSKGTITDYDGNFTLTDVSENAVLQLSFVGMETQEVTVGNRTDFSIVMQDVSISMDELVVVGYGTQKKANLTGAVSAVTMDDKITNRSIPNVSSAMQGLIPGLSVNQNSGMAGNNASELLVRGLGTVNNASPLVVVDGMPDVDINRINMNDIESISVLKDASSSAIYGSRAANGVILITTKSGKGK